MLYHLKHSYSPGPLWTLINLVLDPLTSHRFLSPATNTIWTWLLWISGSTLCHLSHIHSILKLNLIFEVKWNRNALANDTADADDNDADAEDDVPGKLSDSEAENFRWVFRSGRKICIHLNYKFLLLLLGLCKLTITVHYRPFVRPRFDSRLIRICLFHLKITLAT